MPLARLENFLKNLNGNTIYVDPNELDSTDSIENRGNSRTRPFKTIQRALIEAARFSYVPGINNDLFDQTTILISPGTHYIDNRPGYYYDGSVIRNVNGAEKTIIQFSVASNFDITDVNNDLYPYNSAEGGVIVPKGVSLVATDLRKTKIRPKYIPQPDDDTVPSTAIFRLTGGSYVFGFSIYDGNPSSSVFYNTSSNRVAPTYSHHKLTAFEYADGKNILPKSPYTDLQNYYYKLSAAYDNLSGRPIVGITDFEPNTEENKIVGDLGQGFVNISAIISGGLTGPTSSTITVTTQTDHNLSALTPIQITGVGTGNLIDEQQYNGSFIVSSVVSPTQFTYLLTSPPTTKNPLFGEATVKVLSDTVNSSSPYVFNCSLKSVYGMNGLHADGSKATGFKSMVTAQFTGISLQRDDRAFVRYDEVSGTYKTQSELGSSVSLHQDPNSVYNPNWESVHIKASNDAFIQCVSIFAIGYSKQFLAYTGGDQSITNSNSNFGALSLVSKGFKDYNLPKDDFAFVTHIIPPKDVLTDQYNANYLNINVGLTTVGSGSSVYLNGYTDFFSPPSKTIRNYTIGGAESDTIYYQGDATEQSALIVPSYKTSYNITAIDPTTNIITVDGNITNIVTKQAVRIISSNGILPDGLDPDKVYYVNSNNKTSTTLTISDNVNSVTLVDIKNQIGLTPTNNLKLVVQVADALPGDPGSPLQWDATNSNWYLAIQTNTVFRDGLIGKVNPICYIKRGIDSRVLEDKIYRLRVVIPKESENASELSPGFILQKSSTILDSSYAAGNTGNSEIALTGGTDVLKLVRNKGIVIDGWTSTVGLTTTAHIVTSSPHGLKAGNKVNIYDLKSSNEPSAVGLGTGVGFNGSFEVASVVSDIHFTYNIDRNPGSISTVTSSTPSWLNTRNCVSDTFRFAPYTILSGNRQIGNDVPYFTTESTSNSNQIYKIKTIQKYVQNAYDGVYHVELNTFKNVPSVSPFNTNDYKLSQNLNNIYPKVDYDNLNSDPESSVSAASRSTIGKVDISDSSLSSTKESLIQYLKDFNGGIEVSSISQSGSTSTLTTQTNHQLHGVSHVTTIVSGSGYDNGTYFDVPLCGGSGESATARVTVAGNVVTGIVITNTGSGYAVGDTLSVKGIPGSTNATTCVVDILTPAVLGCVQVLGSRYPENNGVFPITSITTNTIVYENSFGVTETSSPAVVLCSIPKQNIASCSYNLTTNISTIITTNDGNSNQPYLPGNKVKFQTAAGPVIDTVFTVVSKVDVNTFTVRGDVVTTGVLAGDYVYHSGLTSQVKNTNSTSENISTRQFALTDGVVAKVNSTAIATDPTVTSFPITPAIAFHKGDFIQIEDEIMLITSKNSVTSTTSTTINVKRGVLGTIPTTHLNATAVRRLKVAAVELRRNSILRASGHTFEYTGFGPGNYSTGMPTNQSKVLTNDETLISQALPSDGGLVVYTGMNSNGEFFIGRKKYDATTGEEILVSNGLSIGTSPSTVSSLDDLTVNTLKVNISIDATTALVGINSLTVSNISSNGNTINLNKNTQLNGDLTVTGATALNSGVNVTGIATATTFVGNGTIPVGGIIMWSGSVVSIPTGWAICDGNNGTPNLQDRFLVGAGSSYAVGAIGGSADATLVSHSHTATSSVSDPGHFHRTDLTNGNTNGASFSGGNGSRGTVDTGLASTGITVGTTISTEGFPATDKNLPPYYALAFIMRTV